MKLLTVREVADMLRLSRSQVYVMVNRKEIPFTRIGKRILIRETDLVEWIAFQTFQLAVEATAKLVKAR